MMRIRSLGYWLVLGCLIWTGSGYSQQVTRIRRPYILINIASTSDLKKGDQLFLYRVGDSGHPLVVGRIEVVRIQGNNCAAKILSEDRKNPIELNDRLMVQGDMSVMRSMGQREESGLQSGQIRYTPRRSHWISYASITAGLISTGLGYYFYNEAELYSKITPISYEHQAELADDIRRYDNQSNFSYYLGGGLIAFGVIHYLITHNKPVYRNQAFHIAPVQKKGYYGMGVQFALKRP